MYQLPECNTRENAESAEWFIENQAFSPSYDVAPPPPPPSHLSHKEARLATYRKTEKEKQLADGRGEGVWEEPNHKNAGKTGLGEICTSKKGFSVK